MKFIKTAEGWYIDQNKIDALSVAKVNIPKGFAVVAFIETERWNIKYFLKKEEAEAWLDDFAAKLNTES